MGTVRWNRVGEGLGCRAEYVETVEDLEPALGRAKAGKEPTVVCEKTSRDANLAVLQDLLVKFIEGYRGPVP